LTRADAQRNTLVKRATDAEIYFRYQSIRRIRDDVACCSTACTVPASDTCACILRRIAPCRSLRATTSIVASRVWLPPHIRSH